MDQLLILLAIGFGVYYAGRIRQWWVDRDTNKAGRHLRGLLDALNEDNEKRRKEGNDK